MKDPLNWLAGEVRVLRRLVHELSAKSNLAHVTEFECDLNSVVLHCAPVVPTEIRWPAVLCLDPLIPAPVLGVLPPVLAAHASAFNVAAPEFVPHQDPDCERNVFEGKVVDQVSVAHGSIHEELPSLTREGVSEELPLLFNIAAVFDLPSSHEGVLEELPPHCNTEGYSIGNILARTPWYRFVRHPSIPKYCFEQGRAPHDVPVYRDVPSPCDEVLPVESLVPSASADPAKMLASCTLPCIESPEVPEDSNCRSSILSPSHFQNRVEGPAAHGAGGGHVSRAVEGDSDPELSGDDLENPGDDLENPGDEQYCMHEGDEQHCCASADTLAHDVLCNSSAPHEAQSGCEEAPAAPEEPSDEQLGRLSAKVMTEFARLFASARESISSSDLTHTCFRDRQAFIANIWNERGRIAFEVIRIICAMDVTLARGAFYSSVPVETDEFYCLLLARIMLMLELQGSDVLQVRQNGYTAAGFFMCNLGLASEQCWGREELVEWLGNRGVHSEILALT